MYTCFESERADDVRLHYFVFAHLCVRVENT